MRAGRGSSITRLVAAPAKACTRLETPRSTMQPCRERGPVRPVRPAGLRHGSRRRIDPGLKAARVPPAARLAAGTPTGADTAEGSKRGRNRLPDGADWPETERVRSDSNARPQPGEPEPGGVLWPTGRSGPCPRPLEGPPGIPPQPRSNPARPRGSRRERWRKGRGLRGSVSEHESR